MQRRNRTKLLRWISCSSVPPICTFDCRVMSELFSLALHSHLTSPHLFANSHRTRVICTTSNGRLLQRLSWNSSTHRPTTHPLTPWQGCNDRYSPSGQVVELAASEPWRILRRYSGNYYQYILTNLSLFNISTLLRLLVEENTQRIHVKHIFLNLRRRK